jgi:hypothetical protein
MMDKSKTPRYKVSGTIPNGLEGFWICPSFKNHFLSRRVPNPNITIRSFFIAVQRGDGGGEQRRRLATAHHHRRRLENNNNPPTKGGEWVCFDGA